METPTPSERGDASLLPRPLSIAEIVSPDDQPIVNPSLRRAGTRTSLSLAQLTRGATAAKQRLPVARAFADEVVTYDFYCTEQPTGEAGFEALAAAGAQLLAKQKLELVHELPEHDPAEYVLRSRPPPPPAGAWAGEEAREL